MAMTEIRCDRPGCDAAAPVLEDPARPGSGAPDGMASMELVDDDGWHLYEGYWFCKDEPHDDESLLPRYLVELLRLASDLAHRDAAAGAERAVKVLRGVPGEVRAAAAIPGPPRWATSE